MSHYKSNLRDIEFNLFEVFGRQEVLSTGPFAEIDEETAREMLAEMDNHQRPGGRPRGRVLGNRRG